MRIGDRYCEHVAREERRKLGILIAFYMAMGVAGGVLDVRWPAVFALIVANALAIGRFSRISEIIDDYDRRTRHLN